MGDGVLGDRVTETLHTIIECPGSTICGGLSSGTEIIECGHFRDDTKSGPFHSHHPVSTIDPVRIQAWNQPAHKSKLSKQYMPEEDSDDETEVRRRSKFMSGTALELNNADLRGNSG